MYMNYSESTTPTLTPLTTAQVSTITGVTMVNLTGITYTPTQNTNVSLLSQTANLALPQTTLTFVTPHGVNNNISPIVQFAVKISDLNLSTIPPGTWDMNIYAKATANSDVDHIGLRYYLIGYNSGTSTYANLEPSGSDTIYLYDHVTPLKIELSLIIPTVVSLTPYDFLWVVVASTNRNTNDRSAQVYFQSASTYSHIHTSFIAIGATGATGPQGVTGATGATGATGTAGAGTLQQTLDLGNGATGANATIALTNTGLGGTANPALSITKNNATAGFIYEPKSIIGRNVLQNEELYRMSVLGNTPTLANQEFARIEVTSSNVGTSNNDGTIDFWASVNGTISEVFRMNGADNENNSFRPLDMNGQDIKTSSGNMGISTTSSTGTGQITIAPKTSSNLIIGTTPSGTNRTIVNADGTGINLQNVNSGFTGVVSLVNQVLASSYLLISQNFGSVLKRIYLISDATGVGGNTLDSMDLQHPDVPFKIKTDNGSFASSNSSLEIDMNPANDANVKAQLTFTNDNTVVASSFVADHYIPVMIAGTQYYIPITTNPT